MIRWETIDRAIDVVVAQCAPEQVFVIGSYATGTAKRTSDLDLLIVAESTESKQRRDERVEHLLAPLMIPVDINVYTPAEFEHELRQPFGFARTATQLQGKLIYSRALGDFTALHERWDLESSATRHERLRGAPAEWQLYQAQYARAARAWPEPAWAFAASIVRGSPNARVADLGCGECGLATAVGRELAAFDHLAADPRAVATDLATLPLPDASMDIAVLSVALVGANWTACLAEAVRIVGPHGRVIVTELAAGRRSAEAVTTALAGCGFPGARARARGPFIDIEARRAG
jgi:predicted nucleotidyltransferase